MSDEPEETSPIGSENRPKNVRGLTRQQFAEFGCVLLIFSGLYAILLSFAIAAHQRIPTPEFAHGEQIAATQETRQPPGTVANGYYGQVYVSVSAFQFPTTYVGIGLIAFAILCILRMNRRRRPG